MSAINADEKTTTDKKNINFSFVRKTQPIIIEQNNKLIEAIEFASDSYWGDPSKFKFRARIDTFTDNSTINQGEERLIKTTFNIKMYGYIIPSVINKELVSTKKFFSKSKVTFSTEAVSNINDL